MKLISEVDSDKVRGGFYTPPPLVDATLKRLFKLLNGKRTVQILEPSSGDGAFIRGLGRFRSTHKSFTPSVTCVEVINTEADTCEQELASQKIEGTVVRDSFFVWATENKKKFDALVGNPPFIRYQFVPPDDRALAEWLMGTKGYDLQGVSNYWIPFVVLGLEVLHVGGAFALVLPAEIFSTVSGGQVRKYLVRHFDSLRVDLYPRDTFPDILQDVVVVSGVRCEKPQEKRTVTFSETLAAGIREWNHVLSDNGESWKRYLLSNDEWGAFHAGKGLPGVSGLKEVATLGVAIVTGANDFFTVDDATLAQYELAPWARPLLARTSDSPGILFETSDHEAARKSGSRCWILDFSTDRPDPMKYRRPRQYLELGVSRELHTRFKCRIREPWYRVPGIVTGRLMVTKRSHHHHRLILNRADTFTTDTIYRGQMKNGNSDREVDLVAGFHNSLTLLSAELEGRSYGGGVLELVPSEVGRLLVPLVAMRKHLKRLDKLSRETGGQLDTESQLIEATDAALVEQLPEYGKLLGHLIAARVKLRDRRFSG
jgi:adenine-specific DNA-methyltransferase